MIDQSGPSIHPLKAIASKFEPDERPINSAIQSPSDLQSKMDRTCGTGVSPVLCPQHIKSPAILIDNELRVIWQNNAALSQLWHCAGPLDGIPSPSVFDLIFEPHFQDSVDNWKQWVGYFARQACTWLPADQLQQVFDGLKEPQHRIIQSILTELTANDNAGAFRNCLRQIFRNGSAATYWVVGTTFDKNRLLVFESVSEDSMEMGNARAAELTQNLEMIRRHPHPVKKLFYALAASLNNSAALRTEMLEEEYSLLLQRIWRIAIETIEQHQGLVAQHAGESLLAFFMASHTASEDNPLLVIQCAMELKSRMSELGREWKIRKGWLHDIELNIGIDAGNEYLLTMQSALGEHLIAMGDTLQAAVRLSALAVNGQIWTTKEMINQVSPKDQKQIRFGIFRNDNNRQIFIAKCFSRIRDLPGITAADIQGDIADQAVTQIFDRHGHDLMAS